MNNIVKGWKNLDLNSECRGMKFEIGKTYSCKGEIRLCSNGFHFHESSLDLFKYYDKKASKVVEVEASGEIITGNDKSVCSNIKIIKLLSEKEIKSICNLITNTGMYNSGDSNSGDSNSGDRNSGYRNSGDSNSGGWNSGYSNSGYSNSGDSNSGDSNSGGWNSGDSNSGDSNSGDRNSGDRNSGGWNKSSFNTGYFNTEPVKIINVFNKPCNKQEWDFAKKPSFIYFNLISWVQESEMTNKEKKDHAEFYCQGGYLKTLSYKNAWKRAWDKKATGDIKKLESLPNFDWKIFTEISGIKKP